MNQPKYGSAGQTSETMPNFWDYNYWGSLPGMQTMMSGGLPYGDYKPGSQTAGTQRSLEQVLGGSKDYKLASPKKYMQPMMEQARMQSKGAKNRALSSMQAAEGAGFDPAMQSYMGGLFDSMPAQMMPEMSLSAAQATNQENAPLIAANTSMKNAAMQGLTNLAAINEKALADMMGLKYATQNQSAQAAMNAMVNLIGQGMGTWSQFMPNVSTGYGGAQYSGKMMPGSNPWDWFIHGQMGQ